MIQNLENTQKYISEFHLLLASKNLFEDIGNFDDTHNSETLKYYEKTISKYANQDNSNELIGFKFLKENQYNIHELIIEIQKFIQETPEVTEEILLSFLNEGKSTGEIIEDNNNISTLEDEDEDDIEEEPEVEDKIKGFNQVEHFSELKKKRISFLISYILNQKIKATNSKGKILFEEYGIIHNGEVLLFNKIISIEENDTLSKTKKLKFEIIKDKKADILNNLKEYTEKYITGVRYHMDRDFELIGLIEYIYIYKYDRLIKKEIFTQIKNRFFVGKNIYNPLQDPNLFERLKGEAISFATEGFLIGIRKYSTKSKNKLITYVTWWIKQRIVYYIENFSSINKGKKTIQTEEQFDIERDEETGKIIFNKYANIKFENYNFVKSDDIGKYEELEKLQMNGDVFSRHDGKIYDILQFFCKHNDIFAPFEYLFIKYDILLNEYIYYMDIAKDEEITACFYKQIIDVNNLLKSKGYPDIMEFGSIKEYYKLPETLMVYFNVEKKEYLTIKRILKQKLINILKNVFIEKKPRKKRGSKNED